MCANTDEKAGNFRTTVLIMTILFCIYTVLCWLFVLLMCGVGFLTKFIYDEHQREELKKKMANVPLAKQAIEKTTKKQFKDYELAEVGDKCIICYCEFEETDEIAELSCSAKHVFHTECIQKWLETNLICPTCREPVKT